MRGVACNGMSMQYEPRPYQAEAIRLGVDHMLHGKGNAFQVLPTGCHALGTRIVMYDLSTKAVEDVLVGDVLMGPDGTPRTVLQLCGGADEMYRISPLHGPSFVVNANHVLSLKCTNEGSSKGYSSSKTGNEVEAISINDYLPKAKYWKHLRKLYRCGLVGVHIEDENLPLDPWILGVILGDGSTLNGCVNICTPDPEISEAIHEFAAQHGCAIRIAHKLNNKAKSLHIVKNENRFHSGFENPVVAILRGMGIAEVRCEKKSVPTQYLQGSVHCRREILAGLLDTDGYYAGSGNYDFISKSPKLSNDVVFLCRSLGITAKVSECQKGCQIGAVGTYYRVSISGGNTIQIPCRVERKKPTLVRLQKKDSSKTGFSVESIGVGEFYGFTLDGDHLYVTDDFVVHHNSGKSIVIAGVADKLDGPVLVFQPSKEILEQNYHKMRSFGHLPAIFSASAGKKQIAHITFATIGSVINRKDAFEHFKHIIVDECHLFSPAHDSMYSAFMAHLKEKTGSAPRILGVTATPYRLGSNSFGSQIRMLHRMKPMVWNKMLYYVQIDELRKMGFLADMEYHITKGIDVDMLKFNTNGSEYTEASVKAAWQASEMTAKVVNVVERLLDNKKNPSLSRKNALVFVPSVAEAELVAGFIPGAEWVCGETPKAERERIITAFRQGQIKCIANVGVLTTGFDYPELDTIILARPTSSLSLYCQMVGRAMRPHPNKKSGWVIDMVGLVNTFGYMEDLQIGKEPKKGLDCIWGNIPKRDGQTYRKQLTNVGIQPQQAKVFGYRSFNKFRYA